MVHFCLKREERTSPSAMKGFFLTLSCKIRENAVCVCAIPSLPPLTSLPIPLLVHHTVPLPFLASLPLHPLLVSYCFHSLSSLVSYSLFSLVSHCSGSLSSQVFYSLFFLVSHCSRSLSSLVSLSSRCLSHSIFFATPPDPSSRKSSTPSSC
jgi:hypothetical protein